MMRLRLLALLLIFATGASAQEMRRLSGYVQIPGQDISKYFIQITITGTKVSGYSITEDNGKRWRATVTGVRDPESEMILEEERTDNPGYCYFSAKLKLTVASGRQRWAGPFESHESNGRLCGKGFMTLLDEEPAKDPTPAKIDPPKPKPVVTAPPPAMKVVATPKPVPVAAPKPAPVDTPKPAPKPVAVVTPKPEAPKPKPVVVMAPPPAPKPQPRMSDSCNREYRWQSDSLIFEVWDGFTFDGDVISIAVDGRPLMERHRLGQQKERFAIPLPKGRHRMNLEFHEEGAEPPNTPNMILYDGAKRYELNISGNFGERVRICFER